MIKTDMEDSLYRLDDGSVLIESIISERGLFKLVEKAYDEPNGTGQYIVGNWEVRGDKETTIESMLLSVVNDGMGEFDKRIFLINVSETSDKKVLEPWFTVYPEDKEELKADVKGLINEVKKGFHKKYKLEGFEYEDEIEKIRNILPHGSGINSDWSIDIKKDVVICKNSYERMNEAGMYDGVFPFSVRYAKDDFKVTFHSLSSKERRIANEEGLKEYLEDTLYPVQKDVLKICNLDKAKKVVNFSSDNVQVKNKKRER